MPKGSSTRTALEYFPIIIVVVVITIVVVVVNNNIIINIQDTESDVPASALV